MKKILLVFFSVAVISSLSGISFAQSVFNIDENESITIIDTPNITFIPAIILTPTEPIVFTEQASIQITQDQDGDGILNIDDNCPATSNSNQFDTDADGIGDACNDANDIDNDEFADSLDNCPATSNSNQFDSDFDGIGDACDTFPNDSDNDGVDNSVDNCTNTPNPGQENADGDFLGDACDPFPNDFDDDRDNDGILDDVDNCFVVPNPGQEDSDFDGLGDACDTFPNDFDNDGVENPVDNCPSIANSIQLDADTDGLGDACDNVNVQNIVPITDPTFGASTVFGQFVISADFDGDEFDDVLASAGFSSDSGLSQSGEVHILYGPDFTSTYTITEIPPEANANFGRTIAIGDVNGDGDLDVIVGALLADVGVEVDAGEVHIFFGPDFDTFEILTAPIPEANANFGRVATGDINNDNFDDVIVGAAFADLNGVVNVGQTFVYLGGSTDTTDPFVFDTTVDLTLDFPNPNSQDQFGTSVSSGDLNNDNFDDVIVYAKNVDSAGPPFIGNTGAVFVFSGDDLTNNVTDNARTLYGPTPENNANFGASLNTGDVDNDGIDDLLVPSQFMDVNGLLDAGSTFVFYGSNSFHTDASNAADLILTQPLPQAGASFGVSPAVGDFNGDDSNDVVVGAQFANNVAPASSGASYLFYGPDFSIVEILTEPTTESVALFGASHAAGDPNDSGQDDVIIGAPFADGPPANIGEVFVFYFEDSSILDGDNDGVPDNLDNCPITPNSLQEDSDGDGIGDACDAFPNDFDDDGVDDSLDNCPTISNSNQHDSDGDGAGEACDSNPFSFSAINSGNWNDPNVWEGGIVPDEFTHKEILSGVIISIPPGQPLDDSSIITNFGTLSILDTLNLYGGIENNGGTIDVRDIINIHNVINNRLDGSILIPGTGLINIQPLARLANFEGTTGIQGTINNDGQIINTDFFRVNTGTGQLTNSGTISNGNDGFLEVRGTLTSNVGSFIFIETDSVVGITPDGTLSNNGRIEIRDGTLGVSGILDNFSVIINRSVFNNNVDGTINNFGFIFNDCDATFSDLGIFTGNSIDLDEDGAVNGCDSNDSAFSAITSGAWDDPNVWEGGIVPGEFDDKEILSGISVFGSELIINSGTFAIDGNLSMAGADTLHNMVDGTIQNNGSISNLGIIKNDGTINNNGIISGHILFGVFTNDGLFTNDCNGTILDQIISNIVLTCRPIVVDAYPSNPTTTLNVISEGGQSLTLTDEFTPKGIRITTGPGTGAPAQISVCGGTAESFIPSSSILIGTCSSVIFEIIQGEIQTTLTTEDGSTAEATLDSGDEFFFDDETFEMTSTAGTAQVTVVAEDNTTTEILLTEGTTVTVDPETAIITADPDNPTDVTIIVDGEEEVITPGESVAPSPAQAIQNLIDEVLSMNIHQGTENALLSNLDSAIDKLTDSNPNNDSAACGKLGSFENKVDAEDGKKLTTEQAETLRGLIIDIQLAIDCI